MKFLFLYLPHRWYYLVTLIISSTHTVPTHPYSQAPIIALFSWLNIYLLGVFNAHICKPSNVVRRIDHSAACLVRINWHWFKHILFRYKVNRKMIRRPRKVWYYPLQVPVPITAGWPGEFQSKNFSQIFLHLCISVLWYTPRTCDFNNTYLYTTILTVSLP